MDENKPTFDRPLIELTISAPADRVWAALRDPALIREWFGWDADTLEAEIKIIFEDHASADDAARVLRFGGMGDGDRFEVVARGAETVVRLVRAAPSPDTDWDEFFEDITQGWIAFIRQLQFALERHPGGGRRTLYLSGSPRSAGAPLAAAALGLADAGRAGEPYAARAAGAELAGRVWHRGRHQIGLTVDGWGDGLLVIMDRPASSASPRGGSQAILTTYGLGDEEFAALSRRWKTWWSEHFVPASPMASDCP
jgi:uncharacterized protein YndB with AHSA1/START domain